MPVENLKTARESHRDLQSDEKLAPLINEHGYLRLTPAEDSYQELVVSIIHQQVSMASAEAMRDRLFSQFDVSPSTMIEANSDELHEAGLSQAKVDYIKSVARAFHENGWSREYFSSLDDRTVMDELTSIHGIGPWTAKMYLQFGLAREDVFPVEDLGIRRAIESLYGVETRSEMKTIAQNWAPYRSIASLYLWRYAEE